MKMKTEFRYMLRILCFLTFTLFTVLTIDAQFADVNRYIEVKGVAEMEVEPNEMTLMIGIEEYWEEEFEKNKEPEDYKTKVPLAIIEDELVKTLRNAGIQKEDVHVTNTGNYWRQRGKEFLFSKQLEVKISDLSTVNQLINQLNARGIKYMNIGELSHSNIESFRKQVKTKALKNAREKAILLLESLDEELGEVLSITEMNDDFVQPYMAKSRMMAADVSPESFDQIQDISISYQIIAKFRIK